MAACHAGREPVPGGEAGGDKELERRAMSIPNHLDSIGPLVFYWARRAPPRFGARDLGAYERVFRWAFVIWKFEVVCLRRRVSAL